MDTVLVVGRMIEEAVRDIEVGNFQAMDMALVAHDLESCGVMVAVVAQHLRSVGDAWFVLKSRCWQAVLR